MRLLADMEQAGFIEQHSGSHRLALEFLEISSTALRSQNLYSAARRSLDTLSQELGLSAYLVIPDGKDVLFMLNQTPQRPLISNITLGSRVPAHTSAPGRILLAQKPASELQDILGPEPLQQTQEHSPTTYLALEELLAQDRVQGFAWSHSGLEVGIDACAAAVFGKHGESVAALSVAGPTEQFNEIQDLRTTVQAALTHQAKGLTNLGLEA